LVVTENYTTDLSLIFMGAHRLAGDMAYIQFLQYYGVRQHSHDDEEEKEESDVHDEASMGVYPRLFEFGQRILGLDPFFNAAVLDVAGSLAFNQKRTAEALKLLQDAAKLDPSFYRYRLYMAAILYRDEGKDDRLIDALAEAIKYPDCPFLLKNILANLYKKMGRTVEAARVYLIMLDTAPSAADRAATEEKLDDLVQKHPELRGPLTPQ
jgi:tetratricopeptide (TPR) repeat protein